MESPSSNAPPSPPKLLPAMQPVTSSNIAAVGWANNTLFVQFKTSPGKTYCYEGVQQATRDAMLAAPSVGSFFASNIKKLPYTLA